MTSLSITGENIRDALAVQGQLPDDDDLLLLVVNRAIRDAWPSIKLTEKVPAAGTFASGTDAYSLAALSPAPHRNVGVALVTLTDAADLVGLDISKQCGQYFDTSADAWFLRVPMALATTYNGRTFDISYNYPHADVTALTDAIYLPQEVLSTYIEMWAAKNMLAEQNKDKSAFGPLYDRVAVEHQRALNRNSTRQTDLTPLPTVYPPRLR